IDTKISIYQMNFDNRADLALKIRELSKNLRTYISNSVEDREIHDNYSVLFGTSKFFDSETYTNILKSKSFINTLYNTNQHLASILTMAVLSSLVSSSNLIRSGDIRYRKSNTEWNKKTEFISEVNRCLLKMAIDLDIMAMDKYS